MPFKFGGDVASGGDVEAALCAALQDGLMARLPEAASDLTISVYRGPTDTARVAQDRLRRAADVVVARVVDSSRNVSRFLDRSDTVAGAPGLTADVGGITATFAGVALAGDAVGLMADGQSVSWHAAGGEDAATVAARVGALLGALRPVLVRGATVSVPQAVRVTARALGAGAVFQELGRVEEDFDVSVLAPAPALRDALLARVTVVLGALPFLVLDGGCQARLRPAGHTSVAPQDGSGVFAGRTRFACEYPLTARAPAQAMMFGVSSFDGHDVTV